MTTAGVRIQLGEQRSMAIQRWLLDLGGMTKSKTSMMFRKTKLTKLSTASQQPVWHVHTFTLKLREGQLQFSL